MNFTKGLQSLLKNGASKEIPGLKRNYLIIKVLVIFSVVIFLTAGIKFLFKNEILPALVLLLSSIIITVYNIFYPIKKWSKAVNSIYILLISVISAFFFYVFPSFLFVWISLMFIPFIAAIMLGINKGTRYSIVFLLLCIPAVFFHRQSGISINAFFYIGTFGSLLLITMLYQVIQELMVKKYDEIANQLNKAKKELSEKNEFITQLSHQLRTSLNNILLVNNLVLNSGLNEKQSDLIGTLKASTNNLIEAVNRIVDFSQSDLMYLKESSISFDLRAAMESIIKLFNEKEHLSINLTVASEIENFVIGDPVRIKQIFLNLLQAIMFARKDLLQNINITVFSTKETKSEIWISFTTDAIFENDMVPEIDVKCHEVEELATVDIHNINKLVSISGGELSVSCNNEKITYKFTFQYLKDITRSTAESVYKPQIADKKRVELNAASILLVEDNQINQKIVILSLQNIVKSIDVANNGKEALDKFGSNIYDLILMDIQMPVMDGAIATKKIREIEASTNTQIPIIAITANALSGDRENCLALGMNDYISKPFQVEILINKMKKLLEN